MKKNLLKSIFAAFLVAAMAIGMTACGDKPADADAGADTDASAGTDASTPAAPTALTEDEYMAMFDGLETQMTELQTSAAELDPTDTEGAKKLLEDLKAPFQEFADVTPPDSYKDAHEKIKSGCGAMVEYIDTVLAMMTETDSTKLQELTQKMTDSIQTAMADMAEGGALLGAAE